NDCSCALRSPALHTSISTPSLHDALPIFIGPKEDRRRAAAAESRSRFKRGREPRLPRLVLWNCARRGHAPRAIPKYEAWKTRFRSEEHTPELQSRGPRVCSPLLEQKKRRT